MGRYEGDPYNLEKLPFRKAKTAVQCTLAGQLTGFRTIGELLLLLATLTNKKSFAKIFSGQRLTSPQNLVKLRSCTSNTKNNIT